jgi:hypothetical protein
MTVDRPTPEELERTEREYVAALEFGRETTALFRAKKVPESVRKSAMHGVDRAEKAYLSAQRREAEYRVQQAAKALGAEVSWGALK